MTWYAQARVDLDLLKVMCVLLVQQAVPADALETVGRLDSGGPGSVPDSEKLASRRQQQYRQPATLDGPVNCGGFWRRN